MNVSDIGGGGSTNMDPRNVPSDRSLSKGSEGEKKFVQISPDSISLIAESVGYSHIPEQVAKSLAEDASYRLRELIHGCVQILRHSKRQRLADDDVARVLRWSDVPSLQATLVDLQQFNSDSQSVDLTRSYDAERRVEVHSAPVLRLRHLSPDGPTDRSNDVHLANYWEKVSRCLLSSSDRVARAGLDDLRDNADLQPLLPSATRFLQDLVRHGKEESRVARRIPMILAALVDNRHFNIDPEIDVIVRLVTDLILDDDGVEDLTGTLAESAFQSVWQLSQILHRLASGFSVSREVVRLTAAAGDAERSLATHCRCLMALTALGGRHLAAAACDWSVLAFQIQQAQEQAADVAYAREALTAALVVLLHHLRQQLERDPECQLYWNRGWQAYRAASDIMGLSILRAGEFSPAFRLAMRPTLTATESCNEFYWTVKSQRRPPAKDRWHFCNASAASTPAARFSRRQIFDVPPSRLGHSAITFQVHNWRQRPTQLLKRWTPPMVSASPSQFSVLASHRLRPTAKCRPQAVIVSHPDDSVL